jgi:hypothetical protein
MKLLFCPLCKDVRALRSKPCTCSCGKSRGWASACTANITGEAKVLTFNLTSLHDAVWNSERDETCKDFHAYVVPETYNSVVKVP